MNRPIDKMAPGVIRSNKQKKNGCMTILCQFANTYKNTVIREYHFGLEPNSKVFFSPPKPTLRQKANSAGTASLCRVHKPANYDSDKYKGIMDYGKGNELKFLHQTNFDLDRVLQLILYEGLYNNITF